MIINKVFLKACPLCHHTPLAAILHGKDFESHTGDYTIDFCSQCGLYITNPQPLRSDLPLLYQQRNTPDFVKESKIVSKLRALSIRQSLALIFKNSRKNLSILDYGCGDGFFASQVAKRPECLHLTATDFHETPPEALKDHKNVTYQSIGTFVEAPEQFDVAICRNVLEHTLEPQTLLTALHRMLKPHGIVMVDVPNFNSVWRKIFGRYYFGLYLPRHLFHFTPTNILSLFGAFSATKLSRTHTPVLARSWAYCSGWNLRNTSITGLLSYPLQVAVDTVLHSSSMLRVVATK